MEKYAFTFQIHGACETASHRFIFAFMIDALDENVSIVDWFKIFYCCESGAETP